MNKSMWTPGSDANESIVIVVGLNLLTTLPTLRLGLPLLILTVFDITFVIINYLQCKYTIPISGNQIFRARKKKA